MTSCVAIAQLSAGRKTFKQATSAGATHQEEEENVRHCTARRMETCARSECKQETGGSKATRKSHLQRRLPGGE